MSKIEIKESVAKLKMYRSDLAHWEQSGRAPHRIPELKQAIAELEAKIPKRNLPRAPRKVAQAPVAGSSTAPINRSRTGTSAPTPVSPPAKGPAREPVSRDSFLASAEVKPHPQGGHLVKGPGMTEWLHTQTTGTPTAAKVVAYSKVRAGTAKAIGFLAPIGIAAVMLGASNEAKAEGLGAGGQIKAAAGEGGKATAVMAGFTIGAGVAVKGLMKAGLTAAKAVPLVNAGMIVGGAIHGAITAKPGERMAGAARGAWDMSLPGMVVNTGIAVKQAIQGRVSSPSPVSSSMTAPARFANANAAYHAMQSVGLGKARHVWDDKARAIALEVRRSKAAAKAP